MSEINFFTPIYDKSTYLACAESFFDFGQNAFTVVSSSRDKKFIRLSHSQVPHQSYTVTILKIAALFLLIVPLLIIKYIYRACFSFEALKSTRRFVSKEVQEKSAKIIVKYLRQYVEKIKVETKKSLFLAIPEDAYRYLELGTDAAEEKLGSYRAQDGKSPVYLPPQFAQFVFKFPLENEAFDQIKVSLSEAELQKNENRPYLFPSYTAYRIRLMEEVKRIIDRNHFTKLVIPKVNTYNNNVIEERLSIFGKNALEYLGHYFENRELFSEAITQFAQFLCHAKLTDLAKTGDFCSIKGFGDVLVGRYDNICFLTDGRLGIVDSESFTQVKEREKNRQFYFDQCKMAMILYPYHKKEILDVFKKFDPLIAFRKDFSEIEAARKNAERYIESLYIGHKTFLERKISPLDKAVFDVSLKEEDLKSLTELNEGELPNFLVIWQRLSKLLNSFLPKCRLSSFPELVAARTLYLSQPVIKTTTDTPKGKPSKIHKPTPRDQILQSLKTTTTILKHPTVELVFQKLQEKGVIYSFDRNEDGTTFLIQF